MKTITAPGPKPYPLLKNLPDLRKQEFFLILTEWHQQYGDLVHFGIPNKGDFFTVRSPEGVQQLLQMEHNSFQKGKLFKEGTSLIGNGLLVSEGDFWRQQRRMMQPAFHRKQVSLMANKMVELTVKATADWKKGSIINLQEEMMAITMDIAVTTLFSTGLEGDQIRELGRKINYILEVNQEKRARIFSFWDKLPTSQQRRYNQYVADIDNVIYRLIDERRRSGEEHPDLLGMLLGSIDEESGAGMDDKQLRDELVTMFVAGHETTALALTWCFILLSQNKTERAKMEEELQELLNGRLPTAEVYRQLPYMSAILSESMRLYPPAAVVPRENVEDVLIEGYPVPSNSGIIINIYALHRHPNHWPNPEQFDPTRFLTPDPNRHRFAYAPFGAGQRQCIGRDFALMEALMILATISQSFQLDLCPNQTITPHLATTLRLKEPLFVQLSLR